MDKILKLVNKLHHKDKVVALKLIKDIYALKTELLDIKKLRGYKNRYRVRKGNLRIVYVLNDSVKIIYVGYKKETTYKNL